MMIEAPLIEGPIAVIPDNLELEAEAMALASTLRRAGLAVDYPTKENCKRRVDQARKSGVQAVLFLRDRSVSPRLHFTHYAGDDEQRRELAGRVLLATKGIYSGVSGGPNG